MSSVKPFNMSVYAAVCCTSVSASALRRDDQQEVDFRTLQPNYSAVDTSLGTSAVGRFPSVAVVEMSSLVAEFHRLADKWERETLNMSSLKDRIEHPAYQAIISMREIALPLILERLKEQGGYWFPALRAITKADPVPPEARGNMRQMRAAWMEWASSRDHTVPNTRSGNVLSAVPETPTDADPN